MITFVSKASVQFLDILGRALNFLEFYSLLTFLIVFGPIMVYVDRNRAGQSWGIAVHLGSHTVAGFSQQLWQLAWIGGSIFFWWCAIYLWKNRRNGFFK